MTARNAIRKYCKEFCCNNQQLEVKLCHDKTCPIWGYRERIKQKNYEYKLTTCKAIKARCKDCMPEDRILNCQDTKCYLHPFRQGRNPNRAGLGHKNIANIGRK